MYLYEKNNKQYALKFLNESKSGNDQKSILNELKILKIVSSKFTTQYYEQINIKKFSIFVLEYVEGGTLINLIKNIKQTDYTENFLKMVIHQIFLCVSFIHDKNIVHCDLNYKNILYKYENNDIVIKLCDFGMSRNLNMKNNYYLREIVGTFKFIAPEVHNYIYTKKADIWSIGVLIYLLFIGNVPYKNTVTTQTTFDFLYNKFFNIKQEYKILNYDEWNELNPQLRKLISHMLKINYKKRISIQQCIDHKWFLEENDSKCLDSYEQICEL